MAKVNSVIGTILGEAVSGTRQQRYRDMLGIASVIANRATMTGKTPQQIVSAPGQFNAYGKSLPKGTDTPAMQALAKQALDQVSIQGPTHPGTFYATPAAVSNLPSGLQQVSQTIGHQYFADPMNRAIRTAVGYVTPSPDAVAQVVNSVQNIAGAVTAPVQNVAANVANIGQAMRTAAFSPVASIPSVPSVAPAVPASKLASYNTSNLTPGIAGVLRSLSTNPAASSVSVNSGYRSQAANASAHGAKNSQHLYGNAVDLNVRGLTDAQKASVLSSAVEAGVKGVGIYSSGNAIHLDTRKSPATWSDSYKGKSVSSMPSWAQPALQDMFSAGQYAVTPRTNPPTPEDRPEAQETMMAAPVGPVERAPLGPVQTAFAAPDRPSTPTPAAALASMSGPTPQSTEPSLASMSGLGFVSSAEAAPMSPQDMQSAVNLGALPAAGVISGMTAPVGQPPSFNSAMMTAPATSLPTQTLGMPSVPSVPSMPSRPVSQTPPAALAAMNNPAFASTPSALTSPDALGPLASLAPPDAVQPTFTPAIAPEIAPPPAAVPTVPTVPNVISAPAQQAVAAAAQSVPSMARAADVYSGAANMGMANDGSTVSRDALGRISVTNKFGATTTTLPGGFQSVSFAGVPSVPQAPTIAGPLSQTSIPSVPGTGLFGISPAKTETGNIARGLTGAFAGSALGSLAGPIGSLIGAAIGKSIAQGKNPLDAFTRQQTTTPGIGMNSFPSAPTSPGALGGTQTNNTAAGMRSISPGAAAAIGRGQGGLY